MNDAHPPAHRKVIKSVQQWRSELPAEVFHVTREKGTERAFTGHLNSHKAAGQYRCACCGAHLFDSRDKFDSGSGWPSFVRPAAAESVDHEADTTHGMVRTEVLCNSCEAHLGHVFEDGPAPTGLRYCINSAALTFESADSDLA